MEDGTFAVFVNTPEDLYQRQLERALSIQDVRHRFVANFTATGREQAIFRGFELNSILTVQSPRPFTIFAGFDVNEDTNPVTDRVGLSGRNTYRGDGLRTVDLRLSRSFSFGQEKKKLQLILEAGEADNTSSASGAAGDLPGHQLMSGHFHKYACRHKLRLVRSCWCEDNRPDSDTPAGIYQRVAAVDARPPD